MIPHLVVLICLAQTPSSEALERATEAIAADPKNPSAYAVRAKLYEAKDAYLDAVRDWTKAIELDPKLVDAYQARGCANFKAGRAVESLADFDKFLEMRPDQRLSHWQRGISCYYAGKFDEGKRQFESYQAHDDADVENAVWRFMCMVRSKDLKTAQAAMLKIGDDRRVPMRDVYDLYLGKKTPADVLAAAGKGEGAVKNQQLFYAHLYLGIWYDLAGDRAKALERLNEAADGYRIAHYMWDVARVHRDRLKKGE